MYKALALAGFWSLLLSIPNRTLHFRNWICFHLYRISSDSDSLSVTNRTRISLTFHLTEMYIFQCPRQWTVWQLLLLSNTLYCQNRLELKLIEMLLYHSTFDTLSIMQTVFQNLLVVNTPTHQEDIYLIRIDMYLKHLM